MKNFTSVKDVSDLNALLDVAQHVKENPFRDKHLGENKTLGLLFFNPSLRTRMSTQRAATNLGMNVMVMNLNKDGWQLEMEDGTIMDQGTQEHIKEAAGVISQYCDIIGVRTFPSLTNRAEDYSEKIISKFIQHATVPIISLESATRHPLQSLADVITINQHKQKAKPKVVLTWAPHPRALPQAVPNSFVEWMKELDVEFVITHPKGAELSEEFTQGVSIEYDQQEALKDADFVYVKNWSSYSNYGQRIENCEDWKISLEKLKHTNNAKIMHCLPVRRNVVIDDEVLDSTQSIVLQQASNRTVAAQAVLLNILKHEN